MPRTSTNTGMARWRKVSRNCSAGGSDSAPGACMPPAGSQAVSTAITRKITANNSSGIESKIESDTFIMESVHVRRLAALQMPSGMAKSQASKVALAVSSRVPGIRWRSSGSTVRAVTPGWRRISEKKSPGARSAKRKERRETPASRKRLWRRRRAAYFMRWLRGLAREECPHEWGQQPGRLRYGAGGGGSSPGSFERQGGGDQFPGMGVAGLAHQRGGGRILDDGATLHDGDLVGQTGDQREVMGNQDIGDSQALLETAEKGGDLGGERGIEAVEGLV